MKYDCDGGSIMIGNESCRVCIPNGYGDGCFSVKVINKEFSEETKEFTFRGTVQGTDLNIYNYDCLHNKEELEENILKKLKPGRYGIYAKNGKIILEKWRWAYEI